MKKLLTTLLILNSITISFAAVGSGWDYENQEKWVQEYGGYQSPININTKRTKKVNNLSNIWLDYKIAPQSIS